MKIKYKKLYLPLLLLALSTPLVFGQLMNPDNWKHFQSVQKINTVLEDGNELWYGTEKGLVVINKETLEQTHYNKHNSPIPSDDVKAIVKIGDTKWIGTYDLILMQISDNGWETIPVPISEEDMPSNGALVLYCMEADSDGNLWLGTNLGAIKYDGENFEITNKDTNPDLDNTFQDVWAIEKDDTDNIYFSSFELFRRDANGNFTNLSEGDPNLFAYGESSLCYANDKLWYSNFGHQIAYFNEGGWSWLHQDSIPGPGTVLQGIKVDKNNQTYFYYLYNGIFKLEGESLVPVAESLTQNGNNKIEHLHFDDNNAIWFTHKASFHTNANGTLTSGILGDHPFVNNLYNMIEEDRNGKIYVINDYKHIKTFTYEEGWQTLIPNLPETDLSNISLSNLTFDSQNDLWISSSLGLIHFDGQQWEIINETTDPNAPLTWCNKLLIDQNDRKWMIISSGEIGRLDGNSWTVFDQSDIPWMDYIYAMKLDPDGNLWLSDAEGNLFRLNIDDTFDQISTSDIQFDEYMRIANIHFDKNGTLWIVCNYNDGRQLFKRADDSWFEIIDDYEYSYYTGYLAEDENGLYFSANDAIVHLDENENIEYITTDNSLMRGPYVGWLHFDHQNNLWINNYTGGLSLYSLTGFNVTNTAEIYEEAGTVKWQAYPIPATQVVTIEAVHSSFSTDNFVTVNLTDVTGKVLRRYQVSTTGGNHLNFDLDVSEFPNGLYYLAIDGLPAKGIVIQR
jgi:ligand-binding sensor domain-containing protein